MESSWENAEMSSYATYASLSEWWGLDRNIKDISQQYAKHWILISPWTVLSPRYLPGVGVLPLRLRACQTIKDKQWDQLLKLPSKKNTIARMQSHSVEIHKRKKKLKHFNNSTHMQLAEIERNAGHTTPMFWGFMCLFWLFSCSLSLMKSCYTQLTCCQKNTWQKKLKSLTSNHPGTPFQIKEQDNSNNRKHPKSMKR